MRDVLILVALWCGAVTAFAAAGAVLWKLVSPHVDRYVRSQIDRATAPLVRDLETVRTEIVSSPEDPSLLEAATSSAVVAEENREKLDGLSNQVGRLGRRVEQIHGHQLITRSVLDQHVAESRRWLAAAIPALEEQGITLPPEDAGHAGRHAADVDEE